MTLQLIDKKRIYFYLTLLLILVSAHNINSINELNNIFKINKIELTSDLDNKLNKDILLNLNKFYNYNIFTLNLDEISKALEKYNIISEYNLKKKYPSILSIHLKKTKILAYYFQNDQKIFIGENGKKIKLKEDGNLNLPLIVGDVDIEKFLKLKKILNMHGFTLGDFEKFYFFKSNRWDLIYNKKIIVKLPNKDLEFSINLFKEIIESKNIENLKIIDLRIKNKIILS